MEKFLEKQERVSGHIARAFENLKRLGKANITLGVVEAKIMALEAKWKAFTEAHEEIEEEATDEDLKSPYFIREMYALTEDQYFLNKGKFLDLVRQLQGGVDSASKVINTTQHLPKISLPKFSGDFAEWPTFRDLFASMVGDNSSLSPIEKMHYLKMSLLKEPAALLASLPVTASNFEVAWTTLTNNYENKRLLTTAQISNICSLQPMKSESSSELKTLVNGTVNAVGALKSLGRNIEGYDDFLVYLTVQKLDKQSRRAWESLVGAQSNPSTFVELQTFLSTRICTIQALEMPGSSSTSNPRPSEAKNHQAKSDTQSSGKVKSHQTSSTPAVSNKCSFCQQEHYIVSCDSFRTKAPEERKAFVLANKLCTNCLGRHFVRECRSQRVCQVCQAKHHTLIHGTISTSSKTPATASDANARSVLPSQCTSRQSTAPTNADVSTHSAQCLASNISARVLLATAVVHAFSAGGNSIIVRALLDQGSEASFVSESLAQRLRLSCTSASVTVSGVGANSSSISRGRVALKIRSRTNSRFEIEFGALVLPRLTSYAPPRSVSASRWPHLEGLTLADPDFTSNLRIDLLIGADVFPQLLLQGIRKGGDDEPVAQNTQLGWILSGRIAQPDDRRSECSSHQISLDHSLSSLLQRFWEQEEISSPSSLSAEDEVCEKHFSSTHSRSSDGRYIVRLPFKEPPISLGNSYNATARMLARMEQRFSRDVIFAKSYSEFLSEYEKLNHMELISPLTKETALAYYLPHHGVIRESSETTKLRVVFNGSQKTSSGRSLNDYLHVGPALLPNLVDVLLRWRTHAVVSSADMEKMYRQVILHEDDRDFQRILWRPPSHATPNVYRLRTVTYGLACAPYLALRVIRQLALDEKESFPLGSSTLLSDVYVDDILSGADDVAAALSKQHEVVELLKAGGFALAKWTSNSPEVLSHLALALRASGTSHEVATEASFHVLGLSWQSDTDVFTFRIKSPQCDSHLTKRKVLSKIAELFDPLGWLAPVIVRAKIFMQSLWLLKLDWDEPLPDAESQDWLSLYNHLLRVSEVRIPRWLGIQSTSRNIELHGFADASERAYAAVVYLCVVGSSRSTVLVAAKTKVAPVKQVSLPRLELCAAHLLVKLVRHIVGVLRVECSVHLWSDSTVTLAWIQGHPTRWKTYAANRVSEIQRTLPDACWRHVESKQNPADCAPRGILASDLVDHDLWWTGPHWLRLPQQSWPSYSSRNLEDPPEQRAFSHAAVKKVDAPCTLLTRYSSLNRLQRIVAWCLRFIENARNHGSRKLDERQLANTLQAAELSSALSSIIKLEQRRLYPSEISTLQAKSSISRGPLLRLNVFLDENGLLRVGGRLKHSILDADERHPIVIPRDSPLSTLLIDHVHRQTLHGGAKLTLATLRQRFWIVMGRSAVKTFIGRCIRCLRFRAATATQFMGDLPKERVSPSRPFYHSGVDYAGPIHLRTSKGRGHKSTKAYIVVFVCFSTKAVHLEAVSDYSTDAFLAAYRRFTSRRGLCKTISSDCGTNFVGADAELRSLLSVASAESNAIATALANDGVEWRFNPPSALHFGGLWEAAVKSVKHHLRRVIGETTLTFEEMSTLLSQIEACLNSRPLGALTDDPEDLNALTPGHFLTGAPLSAVPEPTLEHLSVTRLSRWQAIQQMRESFWTRWSSEYSETPQ